MRLMIVRHADPDYPNDSITPQGHLEAQALARRMAKIAPDHLYCSPMGRARATVKYTEDTLGRKAQIEEWTAERGWRVEPQPWGKLSAWDLPGEIIRAHNPYPTHETWHLNPHYAAIGMAEEFEKVQKASDEFLKRHGYEREGRLYRCVAPNRDKIAVFCHGGFGLTWLAHLLEIPLPLVWAGFWLPPTSVTTILFDERSKEWATPRCIGLSDVSHLYEAGLPVLPRGIKANYD